MNPEPVTAATAGRRLGKTPATIRKWAERYHAAQLGRQNRAVYYDFGDLATIDACIHRRDPVPATPEARAQLRTSFRIAA